MGSLSCTLVSSFFFCDACIFALLRFYFSWWLLKNLFVFIFDAIPADSIFLFDNFTDDISSHGSFFSNTVNLFSKVTHFQLEFSRKALNCFVLNLLIYSTLSLVISKLESSWILFIYHNQNCLRPYSNPMNYLFFMIKFDLVWHFNN